MQAKLLLAPSTNQMLETLIGELKEGELNLIFAEDRLTLEVERAITKKTGGTFLSSVTTFARFLQGEYTGRVLTKQGSVITVGAIATKLCEKLKCFKKNPAGCASKLYETIAQLRSALVTPEMLEQSIFGADEILAQKLKDISLVYREYLDFLKSGYLDESGILELLPNAIKKSKKVIDANVYFVGFTSFTKQAAEGIKAVLATAKSVTGVFIGGKEEIYTNESSTAFEKYCKMSGAQVEKQILQANDNACAQKIRNSVFNIESFNKDALLSDDLTLYEGENEEDELSFIATSIKKEIYANGLRYRDITLFLPDLNAYSLKLSKVFSEYKIPYFADIKKSVLSHPVCRFVLDYFKLIYDGYTPQDSLSFVGNPFFEKDATLRSLYKNYLLEFANYRGGIKREIKSDVFIKDGEQNLQLLEKIQTLSNRAKSVLSYAPQETDGRAYCAKIRNILKEIDAENTQKEICDQLKNSGFSTDAEFFAKGVESLLKVIDEAEILTRGVVLSAEEFSSLLSESLKSFELSLIPQFTDAVFVGSLQDSKKRISKVVFCAGLTSDVPLSSADTALISDKDIDRLRTLKVEIQPKIREVNARARESIALALSNFEKNLYLSYPVSQNGKECKKSEIFSYIISQIKRSNSTSYSFVTHGAIERWERENGAAFARYLSFLAAEKLPAVKELLARADKYRRGVAEFGAHSGLYFALKNKGEKVDSILNVNNVERFIPTAAELMLKGTSEISPTFIEGYFACPYKNFSERGLNLKSVSESVVKPIDTGDFMHAVLQAVAQNFNNFKNLNECVDFALGFAKEKLSNPPFCYLKDTNAGSFTNSSLLNETAVVVKHAYEQIANSDFKIWGAEKSFGENKDFNGVTLLSGKRELKLSGKIDRIDRGGDYFRVIDYKTGSVVDADTESYFTGRKLQLPLYLSALSEYAKPAGAYYFPARIAYSKKGDEYPFRMLGFSLYDDGVIQMSDKGVKQGEKSRYINATLGKSGDKQMQEEDFSAFIDYSKLVAQNCANEVDKGCIAPSPYGNVCEYCSFGGLCGSGIKNARKDEGSIKCTEIADIVHKRRGDK